jgi:predicted nucleotidyltransferase
MISPEDESAVAELAARYGATRVLLFGSSADPDREAKDIDLAVEGVAPADFFAFYGELLFSLSKPVDLIDLSTDSKFVRLVRKEGIPVYG